MQLLLSVMIICFLLIVSFFLPLVLQKKAIRAVTKIFREKKALKYENAVTAEELGIKQRTFLERMVKMRDYKPEALQFLLNAKIVKTTEDNKFYFSEEQLSFILKEAKSRIIQFLLPKEKL